MGILTYLKLGSSIAVILLAGYFYWNYQHRGRVIEAQKIVIEQLEAAEKYYKAQPEIDKHTQELKNEVKKAVDAGDTDRIKFLYDQLRQHQTERKSPPTR